MAQTTISANNNDQFTAQFTVTAAGAITTQAFWVAPIACKIVASAVSWGTAAGAASTVGLFKDPSGTAAGGGTAVCTAVDFSTTADTNNVAVLGAAADITFAAGDKLSIKVVTGTATGSAKVSWTTLFQRV